MQNLVDKYAEELISRINEAKQALFLEFVTGLLGRAPEDQERWDFAYGCTLFSQDVDGGRKAKIWFVFDHGEKTPDLWALYAKSQSRYMILSAF